MQMTFPTTPNLAIALDPDVQAVIFDAFGTLCRIENPRRPFARIAQQCQDHRRAREVIMTKPLDLRAATDALGVTPADMGALEADLAEELASIKLFPDAIETLTRFRERGIKLAIASNLALPYAAPLLALLPFDLDAYAWSFEVGYLKPDPRIFARVCERLAVAPGNALMIGDTLSADCQGATAAGLRTIHLQRAAAPSDVSLT
jgi:HAD superfamily hydrolase (TIGR01549 family)